MDSDWFQFDRHSGQIEIKFGDRPPLTIGKNQLDISYFSTGPGGQNVNKTMNGVRLIYHLPPAYRRAFKKTTELIARSIRQRSREQNFEDAFRILAIKLHQYFYVLPERKKTRIPRQSKKKRLESKKLKSHLKETRKKVDF